MCMYVMVMAVMWAMLLMCVCDGGSDVGDVTGVCVVLMMWAILLVCAGSGLDVGDVPGVCVCVRVERHV